MSVPPQEPDRVQLKPILFVGAIAFAVLWACVFVTLGVSKPHVPVPVEGLHVSMIRGSSEAAALRAHKARELATLRRIDDDTAAVPIDVAKRIYLEQHGD